MWLSFTDKLVGYPERFVGLRNYIYLANDDAFHTVVRNSLVFTVSSVALKIVTGLAMALVLHATWRWRNFFRGLMLLPWITSTVIIALTWRWMFDSFPGRGFFNSVLLDAGLLSRPVALMATPEGAMLAVVIANWWRGFPFFGVSYLAGMQSIPGELYEAASVDGAGSWRRFWHITLPGLKHIIIVTTLLTFIFITDETATTVPVGLNLLIYGDVFHWGQLMAASVITTVPVSRSTCSSTAGWSRGSRRAR